MITSTGIPPADDEPRAPATFKVQLPSSSERMQLHVSTLLAITDRLKNYLGDPAHCTPENGYMPPTPKVREAAEDTFVSACAQLQLLVNERAHWDPDASQKIVDKHMADLNKFNLDAAERRLAVMRHASRPSVMMGCRVRKDDSGRLLAYLPGGNNSDTLFALGDTLNEALDNLDKQL